MVENSDKPAPTTERSDSAFSPLDDHAGPAAPAEEITSSDAAANPHPILRKQRSAPLPKRSPRPTGTTESSQSAATRSVQPYTTGDDLGETERLGDELASRSGTMSEFQNRADFDNPRKTGSRGESLAPNDKEESGLYVEEAKRSSENLRRHPDAKSDEASPEVGEAMELAADVMDVEPLADQNLAPKEAREKERELSKDIEKLTDTVDILREQLGAKDVTIIALQDRLKQLEVQMHNVRLQTIENRPVPLSTFLQISDSIVRIGVITLLGAAMGGPILALATKALLEETIVEGAAAGFIAAVSTEVANRVADPTSHRHRH
jgi:hypothetical protein